MKVILGVTTAQEIVNEVLDGKEVEWSRPTSFKEATEMFKLATEVKELASTIKSKANVVISSWKQSSKVANTILKEIR